ncbi:MAG TPA: lasso peptide biosynthesis B2 protein [Rhodanobacter sp.]
MPYRMREGVSHCQVDGSLIFLDLEEDRYFRLSSRLEDMFLSFLSSNGQPVVDVSELVRQNILVKALDAAPTPSATLNAAPSLSAIEHQSDAPVFDAVTLLEVFATVCSTQFQLRTRRLNRTIASAVAYRQRMTSHILFPPNRPQAERLIESAGAFRHARRCVPIDTSCLLDSISMVKFLARRRLPADIVFGVALNPFAAHCWVQAGEWLLNDTVGNVAAHTQIRKV